MGLKMKSHTKMSALIVRYWFFLLAICVLPSCGGGGGGGEGETRNQKDSVMEVVGSAILLDELGQRNSFIGASVQVFGLEQSSVMVGKKDIPLGVGKVAEDGLASIKLSVGSVKNENLYVVEFLCPRQYTENECDLFLPLHVVLNGQRLKAGRWKANILTELAYQKIAYHVAAGYSAQELEQVLDVMANWLAVRDAAEGKRKYEDILMWDPGSSGDEFRIRHQDFVQYLSESLTFSRSDRDAGSAERFPSIEEDFSYYDALFKIYSQEVVSPFTGIADIGGEMGVSSVVANGIAYVACGLAGIKIIDLSSPTNPVVLATFDTPGTALSVKLSNGYAFVADGEKGLQILDVNDPRHPFIVGSMDTSGEAKSVDIQGNYAFLADGNKGLRVVNISNFSLIYSVARLETPGIAHSVVVSGNRVFLAMGAEGIYVFDATDPVHLKLDRYFSGVGYVEAFAFYGDDYLIASGGYSLSILNISDSSHISLAGNLEVSDVIESLVVSGKRAYIKTFNCERWDCLVSKRMDLISAIDISNPLKPTIINTNKVPGHGGSLAIYDGYLYVTVDLNPPIWGYISPIEYLQWVFMSMGDWRVEIPKLFVIDTQVVPWPGGVGELAMANPRSAIALGDRYAYLVNGADFIVVDVADSKSPQIVGRLDTAVRLQSMVSSEGYVYAISQDGGLYVIDVTNPSEPALVGQMGLSEPLNKWIAFDMSRYIAVQEGYAYVAQSGGMDIVDISSPTNPIAVSRVEYQTIEQPISIYKFGHYVFIGKDYTRVQVMDVGNPRNPAALTEINLNGLSLLQFGFNVSANQSFSSRYDCWGFVCDITAGRSGESAIIPLYYKSGSDVVLHGRYAYSIRFDKVQIILNRYPEPGVLIGSVDTKGYPYSVKARGDKIYVVTSYGLEIFQALL